MRISIFLLLFYKSYSVAVFQIFSKLYIVFGKAKTSQGLFQNLFSNDLQQLSTAVFQAFYKVVKFVLKFSIEHFPKVI